jgi:protein-S-isoprenylcysteine O-methyltransferase Ste14
MIKGRIVTVLLSGLLVGVQFACLIFLLLTGPVLDFRNYAFLLESISVFLALWAIFVMQASRLNVFPDLREGSVLISRGPYRIIRHPMYLAVITFALSLLLAYFTMIRLLVLLILIVDLIVKIEYEEKILSKKLTGYSAYRTHTYKLIPLLY